MAFIVFIALVLVGMLILGYLWSGYFALMGESRVERWAREEQARRG